MVALITELNSENWKSFISSDIVLVDIWASWCGPCKLLGPKIDQLSIDYEGRIKVGKLEADGNSEITSELGIRSIPTIILYKNGEEVERKVGNLTKEQLEELVNKHLS
jgi:thioredoxin 1